MKRLFAATLLFAVAPALYAQNVIINDGQCTIPLRTTTSASIDTATGDIRVFTDATNLCGGGGGTGPTIALSISPTTVASDQSFTVSCSINPGATATCTPTGGAGTNWSTLGASVFQQNSGAGSRSFSLVNTGAQPTTVTFTLACTFQTGSAPQQSAQVTINPQGGGGGDCSGFTPPHTVVQVPFEGVFGGVNRPLFPGSEGNSRIVEISANTVLAVRFVARPVTNIFNDMPARGAFELLNQKETPIGPTSVSLKRCPGDFRNLGDGCNGVFNSNTNVTPFAAASAAVPGDGFCPLIPGETYYINIVHGVPPNLSNNTCPFGACAVGYLRRSGGFL
jgi:hypothetical protein